MFYVDKLFRHPSKNPHAFRVGARYGHMWCHIWVDDPKNIEALHEFVTKKLRMKREWFQNHDKRFPHYDLVPPNRELALKHGALEKEIKEWIKERNIDWGKDNKARLVLTPLTD